MKNSSARARPVEFVLLETKMVAGGSRLLRNASNHLPVDKASNPRRSGIGKSYDFNAHRANGTKIYNRKTV
jgi:hypothetical protein